MVRWKAPSHPVLKDGGLRSFSGRGLLLLFFVFFDHVTEARNVFLHALQPLASFWRPLDHLFEVGQEFGRELSATFRYERL